MDKELIEEIKRHLKKIDSYLKMDGGGVDFLRMDERGTVYVRLKGMCAGCPMSQMTVSNVIEKELKRKFSEIKGVIPA